MYLSKSWNINNITSIQKINNPDAIDVVMEALGHRIMKFLKEKNRAHFYDIMIDAGEEMFYIPIRKDMDSK